MKVQLDRGSTAVTLTTLALFVTALFVKGLSHDLFLETGVFLVSVKIILMSYKNGIAVKEADGKLERILAELGRLREGGPASPARSGPRQPQAQEA